MATPFAFVTLITSDHYLPGALAVAAAVKDLHPSPPVPPEVEFQTVCLVSPETVEVSSIKLLRRAFDLVVGVEIIEQENERGLQLLGRPDLSEVLTKLHAFRLTQFSKIIFLDADVLPIRPLSHLFTLPHEFAAVPDVGWPDIFNSGVLVFNPGQDKFNELMGLLRTKGSWDGGDQGLLNEWRGGSWHRLSFTYNTTPTAAYTYAPAYERFGSEISAIHFIGPNKPWSSIPWRAPGSKSAQPQPQVPVAGANGQPKIAYDYASLVDRWYSVYDKHYRSDAPTARAEFEVRHYASAWDAEQELGTDLPPLGAIAPVGAVLGLDDLRKIAVEGMSHFGGSSEPPQPGQQGPHEGEYRSMPLEGRVTLMRPRREPSKEPEEQHVQQHEGGDLTPTQDRPGFVSPTGGNQGTFYPPRLQRPPRQHHREPSPSRDEHDQAHGHQPQSHSGGDSRRQSTHSQEYGRGEPRQEREHRREDHGPGEDYRRESSASPSPAQERSTHHGHHHHRRSGQYSPQEHRSGQHSPQERRSGPYSPQDHRSSQYSPQEHRPGQSSPPRDRPGHHSPQEHRSGQYSPSQHRPGHHSPNQHRHVHHQQPEHHAPPPRPASPPKLSWNPALEPPPNDPPVASAFPEDTYYPNIWDQAPGKHHDATHQFHSPRGPAAPRSDAFFTPPPQSTIPEQLLQQGQYANVIGEVHQSPPTPDRNKVHAIFPWEEKPRHVPRRVFPQTDAPPPAAKFIESEPKPQPPAPTSAPTRPPVQKHHPAPTIGLPTSLSYSNAWDTVPSIQRYASRLVGPSSSALFRAFPGPVPMPSDDGWKQLQKERDRLQQSKADASSMDGDDEDEGDDEDSEVEPDRRREAESRVGSSQRSRASSSASTGTISISKGKKYYGRAVQTDKAETRDQSVQVSVLVGEMASRRLSHSKQPPAPPRSAISVATSKQEAPRGSGLLPAATLREYKADPDQMGMVTPVAVHPLRSTMPFPSVAGEFYHGTRSPQTLGSPRTYSPPKVYTPPKAPSPTKVLSPPRIESPVIAPPSPRTFVSPGRASPAKPATPRRLSSSQQPSPSPRRSSISSKASSPVVGPATPPQSALSPKLARLASPFSPPMMRTSSGDTQITSSPSTTGPVITPDSTPIMSVRKTGRVWDPARGVDVFKRSSEEVLARFLRMGSFEDEERRAIQ